MKEYIERNKIMRRIETEAVRWGEEYDLQQILGDIEDCPAADVAEVVRCKDCEHCCMSTDPKTNISIQKCGYVGFNPVQSSQVSDDFYCSYGERKEDKNA